MVDSASSSAHDNGRKRKTRTPLWLVGAALVVFASAPAIATASTASSGQLLFYPCTSCHPVHMVPGPGGKEVPSRPLPNGFTGHQIVLQGHDALGKGDTACLTCHDDPTRNPGMLKTADGSLVALTSADLSQDPQVALVCYRCHEDKYAEWKAGTHGKHKPSCVAAGCHDPHAPQSMYAAPLMPFVGTGWQFQVVPQRAPFKALAPPAPNPATVIPAWFYAMAGVGLVVAAGLAGSIVSGRSKR